MSHAMVLQQSTVLRWQLALAAGGTALGLALVSPRFASSVALGVLLETANFRALWRFSERSLLAGRGGGGAHVGAFGLRFLLLAGVLWFALANGAHPVGLVVGLSMIVPAVVVAAWRARPASLPAGPTAAPDDPSWDAWNPWLARERTLEEEDDS